MPSDAIVQSSSPSVSPSDSNGDEPWSAPHHLDSYAILESAQDVIYNCFLDSAKAWPAEDCLHRFRQLFVYSIDSADGYLTPAFQTLLMDGDAKHFHYTINRVCYILINNWETQRNHQAILDLADLLDDARTMSVGVSPNLRMLRTRLNEFLNSKAFHSLEIYVSRYKQSSHWAYRYTSYLLASQSLDPDNPAEQRRAAKSVSNSLKHEFKRDLARYAVYSEHPTLSPTKSTFNNPTLLGERALLLIKKILVRRNHFSCQHLANIFVAQAQDLKYWEYKTGLQEYLVFSLTPNSTIETLQQRLSERLERLYPHYNDRPVDSAIQIRTANKLINFFTTDYQGMPSEMMQLLLSQGRSFTLSIVLLKLMMISPKSRSYLEARIGDLVQYHETLSEERCQWLIQFLEVLRVTFAIYSDKTVHYDLVSMHHRTTHTDDPEDLDAYRIFPLCNLDAIDLDGIEEDEESIAALLDSLDPLDSLEALDSSL